MRRPDPSVERSLHWFLDLLGQKEWEARRSAIEHQLSTGSKFDPLRDASRMPARDFGNDRMGWYLYLADTAVNDNERYEVTEGARVLPIFTRFGEDFETLITVKGIERRAYELLTTDRSNPDGGLFEMLVALNWKRNRWTHVECLEPSKTEKRSDLVAQSTTERWFIECKRLSRYSKRRNDEQAKWATMWSMLARHLVAHRYALVLDIAFHVPLESLPDDFLCSELEGKLRLAQPPCQLIDNETWSVSIRKVNLAAARMHLKRYIVRCPSDQVNQLISGVRDVTKEFSCVVVGEYEHRGDVAGSGCFLTEFDYGAGAYWHCDSELVLQRKARDVRGHLSEAVDQLPNGARGVIHIGLETVDGPGVEEQRYRRIWNTVSTFDPSGRDLRWVYCHLFQSYSPPDKPWFVDETIYQFTNEVGQQAGEPLPHRGLLVPHNEASADGVHWHREAP
jgi:hypothetical protein